MQPSADNRTGYVVDLAGNIYELLRPPGSSVPVQSATIFLFLSLSFSLARFRFHFLALSLSLPLCPLLSLGWRSLVSQGENVRRQRSYTICRKSALPSSRPNRNSFSPWCVYPSGDIRVRYLLAVSSAGLFINGGCRTPSCAHIGRASDSVSLRFTRNSISF